MLLLTVLGVVALGVYLKFIGFPDNPVVRWNPTTVSLRQHGHWTLVAPLLWVVYALISCQIDRGVFSERLSGAVGGILIGAIVLLFVYAIAFAYTRPLLIQTGPHQTQGVHSTRDSSSQP